MKSVLSTLAERAHVELVEIARALTFADETFGDRPAIETLSALMRRLPAGLVHAEAIWLLPTPPEGLSALAEGSPWYAVERSLAVVVPRGEDGLLRLLEDLGLYAMIAERVRTKLSGQDALLAALATPTLEATSATELALLFEGSPARVATIDQDAPGLRNELLWMVEHPLGAVAWIHGDLRPSRFRLAGEWIAGSLLGSTMGPALVVVSETPLLIEHLSPYVRDLGHALYSWGQENPDRIKTPGLFEALLGEVDDDLAALIAAELLDAPDLLAERREAEASQSLTLSDHAGTLYGFADFARLAAPDPALGVPEVKTLWILAGGAPETLLLAAKALFESRRAQGLLYVGEARFDGRAPLVAEAVASGEDAVRLRTAGEVVERAKRLGLEIELAPELDASADHGVRPLSMQVLGLFRRAKVKQVVPPEAPAFATFYQRPASALDRGLGALAAARLGLAALCPPESQKKTSAKAPQNPGPSRFVRRFRA